MFGFHCLVHDPDCRMNLIPRIMATVQEILKKFSLPLYGDWKEDWRNMGTSLSRQQFLLKSFCNYIYHWSFVSLTSWQHFTFLYCTWKLPIEIYVRNVRSKVCLLLSCLHCVCYMDESKAILLSALSVAHKLEWTFLLKLEWANANKNCTSMPRQKPFSFTRGAEVVLLWFGTNSSTSLFMVNYEVHWTDLYNQIQV